MNAGELLLTWLWLLVGCACVLIVIDAWAGDKK